MLNNIETILVCGDLHGMLNEVVFKLNNQHKLKNTACFCAGDIGMGFYKKNHYNVLLKKLNKKLAKNNNYLFLIRGNHDDPTYWESDHFKLSNIIFVKDYTTITINETKLLCIGGAISVDRTLRKEDVTYWVNEGFVYNESLLENVLPDVVITHSAPTFCHPFTKDSLADWFKQDPKLRYDTDQERYNHTLVYDKLKQNGANIKFWLYGHFHHSYTDYVEDTKFVLLNELELYEIKS